MLYHNWQIFLGSMLCFLFWILNAPDVRFGMGYLIVIMSILLSSIILAFQKYNLKPILSIVVLMLMVVSLVKSTRISLSESKFAYPINLLSELFINEYSCDSLFHWNNYWCNIF